MEKRLRTANKRPRAPLHEPTPTASSMTDFKEMPQPKTFAPSKEDVLQNLQYFFGPFCARSS